MRLLWGTQQWVLCWLSKSKYLSLFTRMTEEEIYCQSFNISPKKKRKLGSLGRKWKVGRRDFEFGRNKCRQGRKGTRIKDFRYYISSPTTSSAITPNTDCNSRLDFPKSFRFYVYLQKISICSRTSLTVMAPKMRNYKLCLQSPISTATSNAEIQDATWKLFCTMKLDNFDSEES